MGDARRLGFDAAKLEAIGEYARSIKSDSVLVMKDGEIVYQWYADEIRPETSVDTWSVAKTFTATLVGAAIQRGLIRSVDQRASDFIKEWAGPEDPRRDITIKHLLTGVSGLDTDEYPETTGQLGHLLNLTSDYAWAVPPVAWVKPDQTKHALSAPLTHEPGTTWKYNNRAIQALEAVLTTATGKSVDAFARESIFEPLGMSKDTRWGTDKRGHATMYSSVHASTHDLARFGQLLLNGGVHDGRRIVNEDFARDMRKPSSAANPAYGFLTWLNTAAESYRGIDNRKFSGPPIPSMPADYFSAQGVGNNFVGVSPSEGLVIVHARRAPNERLLTEWPWNNLKALLGDAKQEAHREILSRLNAARLPS